MNNLSLNSLLEDCIHKYSVLEDASFSNEESQIFIENLRKNLEELTRKVSTLSLFAKNEHFHELPSSTIRFLLLPAILGMLALKDTCLNRTKNLKIAKVYFTDFLQRLTCYSVIEPSEVGWCLETNWSDCCDEPGSSAYEISAAGDGRSTAAEKSVQRVHAPTSFSLKSDSKRRELKIRRFQMQKSAADSVKRLKACVDEEDHPDEETQREFYIAELLSWAFTAIDELEGIERELPFAERLENEKLNGVHEENFAKSSTSAVPTSSKPSIFILTRTEMQKKVYGLGYPSVPTLTVEEWYDQAVKDGIYPANPPAVIAPSMSDASDAERKETEEKEARLDRDDPDELDRMRNWDDYKDDHRRGWGNTYNKG